MTSGPAARSSEIAEGTTLRVTIDGIEILLCKTGGEIYAVEDACTHDGAPLDQGELDDCRITCPRHGAVFNVRSGDVLALPAVLPLPTYPVRVLGDDVYVDV